MAWSGGGLRLITVGVLLPALRGVWLSPGGFATIQARVGAAEEPLVSGGERRCQPGLSVRAQVNAGGYLRRSPGEATRPTHLVVVETSANEAGACGGPGLGLTRPDKRRLNRVKTERAPSSSSCSSAESSQRSLNFQVF